MMFINTWNLKKRYFLTGSDVHNIISRITGILIGNVTSITTELRNFVNLRAE